MALLDVIAKLEQELASDRELLTRAAARVAGQEAVFSRKLSVARTS